MFTSESPHYSLALFLSFICKCTTRQKTNLHWKETRHHFPVMLRGLCTNERELKHRWRRRRRQRERRKSNIIRFATLHVHHTFLYISLPSLHDYDVKMPNFSFWVGSQHNRRLSFSFSFPQLRYSPYNSTPEKFANVWRVEQDRIKPIKFEAAQIYFSSDVFVAVAVVFA